MSIVLASQQFLEANATWLESLAAVVGVLVVVWGIVMFFGQKIMACFAWLKRKITGDTTPRMRVAFVLDARRTFWNMAQRDGKPAMQIMVSWHVTNASGMPVRILSAGLIDPNPHGRTCMTNVFVIDRRTHSAHSGSDMPIQPHQTEVVETSFFLDPPTQKENRPLKVRMFLVDQYGQKHSTPRVRMQYKFPSAETY